jgi:predicted CopG family antitoxin
MAANTIEISEDVYERLQARKQDDESFTDLINRLLDETTADWRDGFGTLDEDETEELEQAAEESRSRTSEGLATRQQKATRNLSGAEDTDETT